MNQDVNQSRLKMLDELIRYHLDKFVDLEAQRIKLHRRVQNQPVSTAARIESVTLQSVRAEIFTLRSQLDRVSHRLETEVCDAQS